MEAACSTSGACARQAGRGRTFFVLTLAVRVTVAGSRPSPRLSCSVSFVHVNDDRFFAISPTLHKVTELCLPLTCCPATGISGRPDGNQKQRETQAHMMVWVPL